MIGFAWLADKFRRITGSVMNSQGQETLIRLLATEQDMPIREIIHAANDFFNYK